MTFEIRDYEKYRKKEKVLASPSLEWRKGHIYPVIFMENKDLMKGRILYLGCNDGTSCCLLSPYCEELVGVDINENALEEAKKLIKKEGVTNTKFVHANICDMPFENNSFDGVYAFNVMEHIFPEDQEDALKEIKRVLKKDKFFLVQVPTPQEPYYKDKDGMHVFFFKSEEMIRDHFGKSFKVDGVSIENRVNPGRPHERHSIWMVILKNA